MQGAEILDEGSVLKYMTESEIEEQRSSLLIMTQHHLFCIHLQDSLKSVGERRRSERSLKTPCPTWILCVDCPPMGQSRWFIL